jgi:amino acid transporter
MNRLSKKLTGLRSKLCAVKLPRTLTNFFGSSQRSEPFFHREYMAAFNIPQSRGINLEERGLNKVSDGVENHIPKHISVFSGVSHIVGSMVGTGIFRTVGSVQANVGSAGASIVIWLISGLLSLAGAICYVELGSTFPSSGGDQVYLTLMYGPLMGFMYAWMNIIAMFPGGLAVTAITLTEYLCDPLYMLIAKDSSNWDGSKTPLWIVKTVGCVVLVVMAGVNIWSLRLSTRVTDFFFFVKIGMLCLISVSGWISSLLAMGGERKGSLKSDLFNGTTSDPSQYALALYASLWAYGGW